MNKKVSMRGCDRLVQNFLKTFLNTCLIGGSSFHVRVDIIERLRVTFTSNGKREFVPDDQVSSLHVIYCMFIISTRKLVGSRNFLSIRIFLSSFYMLVSYFEKFST